MPDRQPAKDEEAMADDQVEKAEPAVIRERRLGLEAKRKAAQAKAEEEPEEIRKACYQYFKDSDIRQLRNEVVIHPTVLLSIADHYARAVAGTTRRVVGVLLGEQQGPELHITNTFGVPFEEDPKDLHVWYLDHSYLEKMFFMFKKINARERIAGWYSTGAAIKEADLEIHEIIRKYCRNPLYLMVDVTSKRSKKLPIQTYYSFEQPARDESLRRSFVHVACKVGATEAEEVGVEHLLRDLQSASTSTLSSQINDKLNAIKQLRDKLTAIADYLEQVADGELPVRAHLLTQFQRLIGALPDKTAAEATADAFQLETNNSLLATYVAFATRLVMQIHELVKHQVAKAQQLEDDTQKKGAKEATGSKSADANDKGGTDEHKGEAIEKMSDEPDGEDKKQPSSDKPGEN